MNAIRTFLTVAAVFMAAASAAETVVYKLTMRLKVPRVYNNLQSIGFRKAQTQKVVGYVYVDKSLAEEDQTDPVIRADGFVNKTHKVGVQYVTYSVSDATDVMWRYIGSNKTKVFRKPCVKFSLDLDPSYNIGYDEPDNTLVVTLSGHGASENIIKGSVTGNIGCGCRAYGHVSPTRTVYGDVVDITPLYGTFKMKRVETRR